jgi:hypothetical protein
VLRCYRRFAVKLANFLHCIMYIISDTFFLTQRMHLFVFPLKLNDGFTCVAKGLFTRNTNLVSYKTKIWSDNTN